MTTHLVQFSGGAGSWAAAKRVSDTVGPKHVTLLFADTRIEDGDVYRFLLDGAANVLRHPAPAELVATIQAMPEAHEDGAQRKSILERVQLEAMDALPRLHWIAEGRTPHDVFHDTRMLGNSRFDPCSRILKRQLIDTYKQANFDVADTICYVGIDWSEKHRYDAIRSPARANGGWRYEAPLCEPPWLTPRDVRDWIRREGMEPPRMYALGFAHANCGGGCVKAGQGHWAHLLKVWPDRFAWWEAHEQEMRDYLGKPVSMLTDRQGDGIKKPLTLTELRERVNAGGQIDLFDVGGCACGLPADDDQKDDG